MTMLRMSIIMLTVALTSCSKPVPQEAMLRYVKAPLHDEGPCGIYKKFVQAGILHNQVMLDPVHLLTALKLDRAELDQVKRTAAGNLAAMLTARLRKKRFTTEPCWTPYESPGVTSGIVYMHMSSLESLAMEIERVYNTDYLQGSEYATYGEIHQAHVEAVVAAAPMLLKAWASKRFGKCEEAYRLHSFLFKPYQAYYKDLGLSPAQVVRLLDLYHEVQFLN